MAATTRNPCVGNAVPWVLAGVGAVATQGGTRLEYGPEALELMAQGVPAPVALERLVAADPDRDRRQVGVIDMQGRTGQWTGDGQRGSEAEGDWVAERAGPTWAVQGNSLVGPEVVDAVAETFQASEGSRRHLADRLIEALNAGHLLGGDGRHGETQSAAVLVADPRPGMSRRPDQVTVDLNVCEAPEPLDELRRIYDTVSETLGFRPLQQFIGSDVVQLKIMLHALGFYRPGSAAIDPAEAEINRYEQEAVEAVDRFRAAQGGQVTIVRDNPYHDPRRAWNSTPIMNTRFDSGTMRPRDPGDFKLHVFTDDRIAGSLRIPVELAGAQLLFEAEFDAGHFLRCGEI